MWQVANGLDNAGLNLWYTLYIAVPSHIRDVADSMGFYIMEYFWVRKTTCGQGGGCVRGGGEGRRGLGKNLSVK